MSCCSRVFSLSDLYSTKLLPGEIADAAAASSAGMPFDARNREDSSNPSKYSCFCKIASLRDGRRTTSISDLPTNSATYLEPCLKNCLKIALFLPNLVAPFVLPTMEYRVLLPLAWHVEFVGRREILDEARATKLEKSPREADLISNFGSRCLYQTIQLFVFS